MNMLRKQSSPIEIVPQSSINTTFKYKTPIVLPTSRIDIPVTNAEPSPSSRRRTQLQTSNAIFDPNNASPVNEFMQTLKQRMSVYYEHEINIFA